MNLSGFGRLQSKKGCRLARYQALGAFLWCNIKGKLLNSGDVILCDKTRLLQSLTDLDYSTRKRGEDYFR